MCTKYIGSSTAHTNCHLSLLCVSERYPDWVLFVRNYLTGFSKRKKLRKKQAKADETKKELAKRKEKRAEVT